MQPIIEELPCYLEGEKVYEVFQNDAYSFLLDSGIVHHNLGRYSFMGSEPFLVFRSQGFRCNIQYLQGWAYYVNKNPFTCLHELVNKYKEHSLTELPFVGGGAVGYMSYDMGRSLEKLPYKIPDDIGIPECLMAFYDSGVIIDHLHERTYIFSTGLPWRGKEKEKHRDQRFRALFSRIKNLRDLSYHNSEHAQNTGRDLRANFSKESYLSAVNKALDYIGRGDIYQVNLTQRFEARFDSSPWELYKRLKSLNPSPFASFLNFPEVTVVSSSPERFLRQEGTKMETRPIKGTRPRGRTSDEDYALRQELWESSKDQAELVMIVDLERNDLSKICKTGTVKVPELFTLEEYATVHHLVSTVEGELRPESSVIDVLQASFPGGSITGAPKIRAMEIIEELEPVRRGIYTGSIGYIDFNGHADLNIVIRTIIIKNNRVFFQVGGGIVADSSPQAEYQETLDKAKALLGALGFEY